MSEHIKLIASGINVAPIYWALLQHPGLWDAHTTRTEDPASPHHGLNDIWARFGEAEHAENGKPHDSKWYPSAGFLGIKQVCFDVMHKVGGVELGGVLITRIPPGAECRPHTDPGWHARRYDKFALQITSAPGQIFNIDDGALETKPGDLFWFDNSFEHWVTNPTKYERITMIICIRMEK